MTTYGPELLNITESLQPAYRKVRDFSYRTNPHSYNWYSRSINPRYRDIHKQDDVTRYNSSVHNVSHYQDYPNRATTPKKSPEKRRQSMGKTGRSPEPHEDYVRSLLQDASFISEDAKLKLLERAKKAELRVKTAVPVITRGGPGRLNAVINDYHIRETNPGFARNKFGGFYTR